MRVVLVGLDPLARGGVAALLEASASIEVTGQHGPEEDLREAVRVEQPDAAVVDSGAGGEVSREMLEELSVPAVVLVVDARSAPASFEAGARGVLPREASAAALRAAVRAVVERLTVFDGELFERTPVRAQTNGSGEALTPRELEVLSLMAEGLSNKQIASRLSVSEHTAKFHVNAILQKLSAHSRTDAVVRASRAGLLLL